MTVINIPAFSGLNILAAPQRIREDEATVAIGCDFRSLDLRPFRGDEDTGMGTTLPGITSASIFQWDDSHWVGTLGDKNFARSPTFYADGSTGQRIFVCDNAAPVNNGWDWVQDVVEDDLETDNMRPADPLTGVPGSYFLQTNSDGIRRLGVPKPGDIAALKYDAQSGSLIGLSISTGNKASANATFDIPTTNASGLEKLDRIFVYAPGFAPVTYTVTDLTPVTGTSNTRVTLKSTYRAWKQVSMITEAGSNAITFKLNNHGFSDGDQLLFSHRNTGETGLPGSWPSAAGTTLENVWIVTTIDTNKFTLSYYDSSDELQALELSGNATTGNTWLKRVAVLAASGYLFDAPWAVTVTRSTEDVAGSAADRYQMKATFTFTDETEAGTWESATETLVDRSYVVTWVNPYGDESEPSNPTKTFPVAQGDPVTFKGFPLAAATYPEAFGSVTVADYRTPKYIRLYRTDALGTYRLVTTGVANSAGDANGTKREILWENGADDFIDTYPDTELGEPLATAGWQVPPKDLNGILITPGGSLAGYRGRSVFGSVPYAPYAFPIGNRVAFDYNVRGLVATSAGLVVVTEGMPALIVGDDPGTWSIQKLEYPYGCVSRRSIVDMGELAIYASADGLVGVAGASVEILTKDTLTREQWQARYSPANIIAAHAEGRYYGITTVEGTRKAFMFDPRTRSFIDLTVTDPYPIALYSRLTDDTLLILKTDGKVYGWNRKQPTDTEPNPWVPYTWRSKYFQFGRPELFGCAQILSPALLANHELTMRLLAWDGTLIHTLALFSNREDYASLPNADGTAWEVERRYPFSANVNPFRLPVPNNRYTVYQVELQGTLPIGQVTIAATMDEIRQV